MQAEGASGAGTSDAVAAIIHSISDELYQVDRIVSSGGEDRGGGYYSTDGGADTDAASSLLAVAPVAPTDTMQAVASGSTRAGSSLYRSQLLPSDTALAVAESATLASSYGGGGATRPSFDSMRAVVHPASSADRTAHGGSGGGAGAAAIRRSDTMQAVVDGVPVAMADRTAPGDLFPPVLALPVTVPSPGSGARARPRSYDPRAAPSAPRSGSYRRSASPVSSNQPSVELDLSPGHVAVYPIDLSEAPSPPHESSKQHQPRHSFSVPEDRIRALYEDPPPPDIVSDEGGAAAAYRSGRPSPSPPSRSRGSASPPHPRRRGIDAADALERARNIIQPSPEAVPALSAALTPTSHGSGRGNEPGVLLVQGMQQLASRQERRRQAQGGGARGDSRASSTEPDSDAAVVHSRQTSFAGAPSADSRPLGGPQRPPHPPHPVKPVGTHQGLGAGDAAPPITPKTENKKPPPQPGKTVGRSLADTDEDEPEDYDSWLDSALATQTFDRETENADDTEGEEGVEVEAIRITKSPQSLNDWLDSVIP
jgi:hypothetical protein